MRAAVLGAQAPNVAPRGFGRLDSQSRLVALIISAIVVLNLFLTLASPRQATLPRAVRVAQEQQKETKKGKSDGGARGGAFFSAGASRSIFAQSPLPSVKLPRARRSEVVKEPAQHAHLAIEI